MNKVWEQIVQILKEKKSKISTMESCTGGGVANAITNISGASEIIELSYVTYSNLAKIKIGVKADTIEKYTVYSPETAIEMAEVVRKNTKSQYGIGVTGQLGRIDPNNPIQKLNIVFFAISKVDKTEVFEYKVSNSSRDIQKEEVINEVGKKLLIFLNEC